MAGGSRGRLINAARRSMIQRAELHRKLDTARAALKPKALLDRGKYRARASLDDAAYIVREEFRDNRLPIVIFGLEEGNIARVVRGEKIGTVVSAG